MARSLSHDESSISLYLSDEEDAPLAPSKSADAEAEPEAKRPKLAESEGA